MAALVLHDSEAVSAIPLRASSPGRGAWQLLHAKTGAMSLGIAPIPFAPEPSNAASCKQESIEPDHVRLHLIAGTALILAGVRDRAAPS